MTVGGEALGAPVSPAEMVEQACRAEADGFGSAAHHMRDYLSVLVPLLRDGHVAHHGPFYRVDGGFAVPGTSAVPVLVGALAPRMVDVAGELADGVVTWLVGPRLESVIVARLRGAGRRRGRGRGCRRAAPLRGGRRHRAVGGGFGDTSGGPGALDATTGRTRTLLAELGHRTYAGGN